MRYRNVRVVFEVDVVLLDVDDGRTEEGESFANECRGDLKATQASSARDGRTLKPINIHLIRTVCSSNSLTEPNHALKLTNGDPVRVFATDT